MEKATKLIAELKLKVKQYEQTRLPQDVEMGEANDPTGSAIREQIRFFTEKLESTSKELEEKELVIDRIE